MPTPAADFQQRITLERTGLTVSRIGLASGYGIPAEAVLKAWREYGINYFMWGTRRHEGMRQALRGIIREGRDKAVIALQSYDHFGFLMGAFVEKGLKALGADYADVLIMSWCNRRPRDGAMNAAYRLVEQGKVRFLGLSGHNRSLFGALARQKDSPFDLFMLRYNAVNRGAEEDVFPLLPRQNRPIVVSYTATAWGRLLKSRKLHGIRPLTASECYRFALSDPHVDICLAAPRSLKEMDEGLAALAAGPMSEDEMAHARLVGDHIKGVKR